MSFFRVNPVKEMEKLMREQGAKGFMVECCKDTDNKTHIPSDINEYSYDLGNLNQMPLWLVEEICAAMKGRPSYVFLERHIGSTMHIKVGKQVA